MEPISYNANHTISHKAVASIDESAEKFVSVMFSKFVSAMFENKETDSSLGGGGFGEEMYQGIFSEILATKLAQSGVADGLKQNIKQTLEAYKGAQNVVDTTA